MSELGDRLKKAREEKKINQSQLAKIVGCKASNISQLESGALKGSSYIVHIARALDVSPFWLVFGTLPKSLSDHRSDHATQEIVALLAPLPESLKRELIGALKLLIAQSEGVAIKRKA